MWNICICVCIHFSYHHPSVHHQHLCVFSQSPKHRTTVVSTQALANRISSYQSNRISYKVTLKKAVEITFSLMTCSFGSWPSATKCTCTVASASSQEQRWLIQRKNISWLCGWAVASLFFYLHIERKTFLMSHSLHLSSQRLKLQPLLTVTRLIYLIKHWCS